MLIIIVKHAQAQKAIHVIVKMFHVIAVVIHAIANLLARDAMLDLRWRQIVLIVVQHRLVVHVQHAALVSHVQHVQEQIIMTVHTHRMMELVMEQETRNVLIQRVVLIHVQAQPVDIKNVKIRHAEPKHVRRLLVVTKNVHGILAQLLKPQFMKIKNVLGTRALLAKPQFMAINHARYINVKERVTQHGAAMITKMVVQLFQVEC